MGQVRTRRIVAAALVALPLLGAMMACANILGIDSDRHLVADAGTKETGMTDAGDAKPGRWDCLKKPNPTPTGGNVDLTVLMSDALKPSMTADQNDSGSSLDVLHSTPLAGVRVRACATLLDPKCETSGSPWQTTDEAGKVHFTVPDDFGGFFQAARSDLLPYGFFPGSLPANVKATTDPFSMVSLAGAAALVSVLAVDAAPSFRPDGGYGLVFFTAYDCFDDSAPGITATISTPEAIGFYATAGFISLTATETQPIGAGGFFNVPIGAVTVSTAIGPCPSTTTDCSDWPDAGTPLGSVTVPVNSATADDVWFRPSTLH